MLPLNDDVCEGCGVLLQSDGPDKPGYVPPHIFRRGEQLVCRRCYRMNHYGEDESGPGLAGLDVWSIAADVIAAADCTVMVVDMLDFEGTFMSRLAGIVNGNLFIAANKIDLLPSKTPVEEIEAWVKDRLAGESIRVQGIFPVSATTGYGVRVLLDALKKKAGRGGKIGLVGATNVGKSTLLRRWLGPGDDGPTISSFPGTTLGVVEKQVGKGDLYIWDTPGISTRGRLSELFCPACSAQLVPASPITSKLLRLFPGQSVTFGGLASMTPLDLRSERITLTFTSGAVATQRVNESKGRSGAPRAIQRQDVLCSSCRKVLHQVGWEQVDLDIAEMEDVAIHGLGWLSPRRGPLRVRVTVPSGVLVTVRPRLIGPKTPADKPVGRGRGYRARRNARGSG